MNYCYRQFSMKTMEDPPSHLNLLKLGSYPVLCIFCKNVPIYEFNKYLIFIKYGQICDINVYIFCQKITNDSCKKHCIGLWLHGTEDLKKAFIDDISLSSAYRQWRRKEQLDKELLAKNSLSHFHIKMEQYDL